MVTANGLNELPGIETVVANGIPLSLMVRPALPATVPTLAVTVAEPAAIAVTRPVALTVATLCGDTDQVIAAPLTGLPCELRGTAVNCTCCPISKVVVAPVTETLATGSGPTTPPESPLHDMIAVPESVSNTSRNERRTGFRLLIDFAFVI